MNALEEVKFHIDNGWTYLDYYENKSDIVVRLQENGQLRKLSLRNLSDNIKTELIKYLDNLKYK